MGERGHPPRRPGTKGAQRREQIAQACRDLLIRELAAIGVLIALCEQEADTEIRRYAPDLAPAFSDPERRCVQLRHLREARAAFDRLQGQKGES